MWRWGGFCCTAAVSARSERHGSRPQKPPPRETGFRPQWRAQTERLCANGSDAPTALELIAQGIALGILAKGDRAEGPQVDRVAGRGLSALFL